MKQNHVLLATLFCSLFFTSSQAAVNAQAGTNIWRLTRDIGASGLSQGCTAQSCLVEVRKADGPLPPVTAHALPEFSAMR